MGTKQSKACPAATKKGARYSVVLPDPPGSTRTDCTATRRGPDHAEGLISEIVFAGNGKVRRLATLWEAWCNGVSVSGQHTAAETPIMIASNSSKTSNPCLLCLDPSTLCASGVGTGES